MQTLEELIRVVSRLRKECPWDKEQTHRSLTKYLIEEAHETADAVESGDMTSVKEELGDVLLQVLLHAEIASESGAFNLEDVARTLTEKMIRRHPHVFGEQASATAEQVRSNWERIKAAERKHRPAGLLEGVPVGMPSLMLGQRYGEKASSIGFDWNGAQDVLKKAQEELDELRVAIASKEPEKQEEEFGDLIFTLCNLARHLGLDAEVAGKNGARKFAERMKKMEQRTKEQGRALGDLSQAQLETLWNEIKST